MSIMSPLTIISEAQRQYRLSFSAARLKQTIATGRVKPEILARAAQGGPGGGEGNIFRPAPRA